jgi:internalin A
METPDSPEDQYAFEEAQKAIEACRSLGTAGTELLLHDYELTRLPPEIWELKNLRRLSLINNKLTQLPPEIGQLTKLTQLYLSTNQLTSLPSEIGKLGKLTYLDLASNLISQLPPEIGSLISLTNLDLRNNQLSSLPKKFTQLKKLTELLLGNNRLTTFPLESIQIPGLIHLHLNSNFIKVIPPEIGTFKALKRLYVGDNSITKLPPEIGQISSLELLSLRSNKISSLPSEIGFLQKLTQLSILSNRLTSLPPEISRLSALKLLYLSGNQLRKLPPEFIQLKSLTNLTLGNNNLEVFPPEICNLTALKDIALNNNKISEIPSSIANLRALEHLHLSQNFLTSLPNEIGALKCLEILDLHKNRLSHLPPEISDLNALDRLYLHENTSLGIPEDILGPPWQEVKDGKAMAGRPKSILGYYFEKLSKGTRPLNEVKLLLLGRGEAGKTSLSRALRGKEFKKDQAETPGIEIRPWLLDCPAREPVKVHMWDFAGQEITHETHRFFLTERSLYLVVLDGRGGQQMEEAEYWLSHVERFGSRKDGDNNDLSPVIMVLNKWQSPGPYEVEKRRLQREHPNIRAFVETDCLARLGIEKLRETVCAVVEQMPAVRQEWPLTYFQAMEKLDELATHNDPTKRRPFLNWEEYRQVCADCGITDQDEQTSLAENLNSLGVALYYGNHERLRDMRVLTPNWAANGLYGLVRGVHRKPFQGKAGQLWQGEFSTVLSEGLKGMNAEREAKIDDYPEKWNDVPVHDFLLKLMQDRELGFQAGKHQNIDLYLLPGLLSLDEPEPKEYDVAAHMDGAQVRFRYLYELLPAGVMSRMIIRTHSLSEDHFRWQRGVVLGWGNARALVMAERRRNPRVDVFIKGGTPQERQELAGVVRKNMEDIHYHLPSDLRGVEELDLTLAGAQFERVDKLLRLEADKKPLQVVTSKGTSLMDASQELEQIQPAAARQESAPMLKIFISYAHYDHPVLERLKTYLDILKNNGEVDWWFDGKIRKGSEWDDAIRLELEEADIVMVLLSNAFFSSKYIQGVEMREARRRQQTGDIEILPVLLEPTEEFAKHKWLNKLQTVPSQNGQLRPLTSFNPRVNGWSHVDKALREMIADVAAKKL